MPLSIASTANSLAAHWASLGATYSLHTGHPGANGTANEATGGGYERETTTWGTPASGVVVGSQMVFNINPGSYTYMCRWSAGGALLDVIDNPDVTITPAGEAKVTPSFSATYALPA